MTARTSREAFCERDGEAFSDRRDRVFAVAFEADRRQIGVGATVVAGVDAAPIYWLRVFLID